MPSNLYCDQSTPPSWQGVYFFTNTVKVGAETLMHCCVVIFVHVVGMIIDFFFMITMLILINKGL